MASEAQIWANQMNSLKSTGPVSNVGRERAKTNSYKHEMTASVVMPEDDAAEVERLAQSYRKETNAQSEVELDLTRRMAVMAVRMRRCVAHEEASRKRLYREAYEKFETPEGASAETAEFLRKEAASLAMFDTSKHGYAARRYEASAERCYFQSMKELRQIEKKKARPSSPGGLAQEAIRAEAALKQLASFLPAQDRPKMTALKPAQTPQKSVATASPTRLDGWDPFAKNGFDVPIAIGKPR